MSERKNGLFRNRKYFFGSILLLSISRILVAVSYTHLDVYKGQPSYRTSIIKFVISLLLITFILLSRKDLKTV